MLTHHTNRHTTTVYCICQADRVLRKAHEFMLNIKGLRNENLLMMAKFGRNTMHSTYMYIHMHSVIVS